MVQLDEKIALGTVQFGLDYGINNPKGKVPFSEVKEILLLAHNNHIDTLDTASVYGDSEEILGNALSEINVTFKIISKLPKCDPTQIEQKIEDSFKKLGVESLYGYLVHDFEFFKQNPFIKDILTHLKSRNMVQKIGFSLYYPSQVNWLIEQNVTFDVIQIPFNVFDQRFLSVFSMLKERDVEIHVRSIFLQGLFFKETNSLSAHFNPVKGKLRKLKNIIGDIPISAALLNFGLLNEAIDKVVIGVDSIENLMENVSALKYIEQTEKIYSELCSFSISNENILLPFNWKC